MSGSSSSIATVTALLAISLTFHDAQSNGSVTIVGAGMAGCKLAHDFHKAGIPFIIVEATDRVGGRMRQGLLYKGGPLLELGANWLQGYRRDDEFSWLVRHKLNLGMVADDVDDYYFYSESGKISNSEVHPVRIRLGKALANIYELKRKYAVGLDGRTRNDISVEDAFWFAAGWHAITPIELALQQEEIDYEYARRASLVSIHELSDFYDPEQPQTKQFYITEEFGYRKVAVWHLMEAGITDVDRSGPNLMLNSPVVEVKYDRHGSEVILRNGQTITGGAVVVTTSLGVLRGSIQSSKFPTRLGLQFSPELPYGKRLAISKMSMGTYVKLFIKFHGPVLTDQDPLYLRPLSCRENYFTSIQNLNKRGYIPGENIVLYTAVGSLGRELECTSKRHRLEEALAAMSLIVGQKIGLWQVHSVLFSPFLEDEFFQGMYSGRPVGVTDEDLENFRKSEGSLFFAGEAYAENQGYVQSAYYSAKKTAKDVIEYLRDRKSNDR